MHEADGLGILDAAVLAGLEILLKVGIGNNPFVDVVAVFLFPFSREELETGCNHKRLGLEGHA